MLPFILFNILWISGSVVLKLIWEFLNHNLFKYIFCSFSLFLLLRCSHCAALFCSCLRVLGYFILLVFVPFAFQFSTFLFVYPQAQRLILPLSMSNIFISSSKIFFILFTAFKKFWWFPHGLHLSYLSCSSVSYFSSIYFLAIHENP